MSLPYFHHLVIILKDIWQPLQKEERFGLLKKFFIFLNHLRFPCYIAQESSRYLVFLKALLKYNLCKVKHTHCDG